LFGKGEKDFDDLRVEQSQGAADEPPIHELAEDLSHDVKIEQKAWIGLAASGCPSAETRRPRIWRPYAPAREWALPGPTPSLISNTEEFEGITT
jgi:hypothetical protein